MIPKQLFALPFSLRIQSKAGVTLWLRVTVWRAGLHPVRGSEYPKNIRPHPRVLSQPPRPGIPDSNHMPAPSQSQQPCQMSATVACDLQGGKAVPEVTGFFTPIAHV